MVILYFVLNTIQRIKKKFCFSHLPLRIMLLISILSWIFLQIYANDNFHTHGTIICLLYWLIGLALSKINLCLSKFHLAIGCLLLAISSIILRRYGFYDGVGMHRAYYFTTALLAVSIFCFFLHVNINNSNIISRIGRVNSIHIYIVHWVLIEILFRIGNDVSPYLYFLSPLIIFFVSYVLSETYLKILVNRFPTKCKK